MQACEQAPGYSVYQHGLDVAARYADLFRLRDGTNQMDWYLDQKTKDKLIALFPQALDPQKAYDYHLYHDCGKPFCRTVGEDGRVHFPGHAGVSERTFKEVFFHTGRPDAGQIAELIGLDMWCHTAKGVERGAIAAHPQGATLLLTAYSELHANASRLFGGFESDSFKIKRKNLEKVLNCF